MPFHSAQYGQAHSSPWHRMLPVFLRCGYMLQATRSDPLDSPLIGLHFDGYFYFDITIPFGLRWGKGVTAQRINKADILCPRTVTTSLDISYTSTTWYIELLARTFSSLRSVRNYLNGVRLLHNCQTPIWIISRLTSYCELIRTMKWS